MSDRELCERMAGFLWQDDEAGFHAWRASLSDEDRRRVHALAQRSAWVQGATMRAVTPEPDGPTTEIRT